MYFKLRKIEDDIRKAEIRLIAYSVNFFGEAIVGSIKQNGVPYINFPLASAMAVSFARFCYYNAKEIRQLTNITKQLHEQTEQLEQSFNNCCLTLPQLDTAENFLDATDQADENFEELLDFFREEST